MSLPTSTPSGLAVTVSSNTAVSVSWTNLDVTLAESGFSAITMYTVEYKLSTDTTWNYGANSTSTPVTISGLTSLSTYSFRVKATNVFGTGPTTLTANVITVTLNGVPSSPGQPTLTQTSGSTFIVATWSAPSSTNGASISAYSIEVQPKITTNAWVTLDSKCTEYNAGIINYTHVTCTILMTDLMTLASYTSADAGTYILVKVSASNTYGSSPYSTSNVNSIQVETSPSGLVSTVVLSKTKNTFTATWTSSPTAAVDYGYAPITYYLYRYKLTSGSWPADWTTSTTTVLATSSLTATLTGLTA
jgi:hypothetical protein